MTLGLLTPTATARLTMHALARFEEAWADRPNVPDSELMEQMADLWHLADRPDMLRSMAARLRLCAWQLAGEMEIRHRTRRSSR